ncbi:hypothetical protein MAHJHV63_22420 [Mycobacterium avium subsp. hominissuis]
MRLDEYMALDATALAGLVADKQVTPAELLALARQRADAVNPRLNAIVCRLDDVADRQAADPNLSGPFAGVPFLLKDLGQEYRGFPTSCGSRSLANDVADRHALVTQRFLDAGLVIFGKTNTPEFGAKGVTEPDYWGPARNPWHTGRTLAARRADPARRWRPASSRPRAPTTVAGRSASRPPATASSASSPAGVWRPTARRPAS